MKKLGVGPLAIRPKFVGLLQVAHSYYLALNRRWHDRNQVCGMGLE